MNRIGRKHMLVIGIALNCIGIGLLQASHEWKLWLVGKFINAMGFGFAYTMSPVWYDLMAIVLIEQGSARSHRPKSVDSFFASLILELYSVNGLLCILPIQVLAKRSVISRGTSTIDGKWGYMSLIVMQYFFPLLLLCVYPFFPESPYYLIKKGKPEEARKSLNRIHGSGEQEYINLQMVRIEKNVRFSEELAQMTAVDGPAFFQLFRGINLVQDLERIT